MSLRPITPDDAQKLNAACKMIEADGAQAYWSCRAKYGENVANAILVCWLRSKLNDKPDQYPPPEELPEKVNASLIESGLLVSTDDERLSMLKISERLLVLSHVLRADKKTAEADELNNYHNMLHELARGMK